jgi:hypothetical protein
MDAAGAMFTVASAASAALMVKQDNGIRYFALAILAQSVGYGSTRS